MSYLSCAARAAAVFASVRATLPSLLLCAALPAHAAAAADGAAPSYDVLISGGTIYDGSGGAAVHRRRRHQGRPRRLCRAPRARQRSRASSMRTARRWRRGSSTCWRTPRCRCCMDGRALSDLRQGVTLEVMGEDVDGPADARDETLDVSSGRATSTTTIDWTTLGEYLEQAGEARHRAERRLVRRRRHGAHQRARRARRAADRGAAGADAGAGAPGDGGGRGGRDHGAHLRAQHLRQDAGADRARQRVGALRRHLQRAHAQRGRSPAWRRCRRRSRSRKASGAPAEIYHLKVAGKRNWSKLDRAGRAPSTRRALPARASPLTCTCTRPVPPASMPPCRPGCRTAGWRRGSQRLKDPATRQRVIARDARRRCRPGRISMRAAGPAGMLLLEFKNPQAEAADRQDARRGRARARASRPRMPPSTW